MKNIIYILFAAAIVCSSMDCEEFLEHQTVEVVAEGTELLIYEVHETGAFSYVESVTAGEFKSAIDIPSDATIKEVQIKSVGLNWEPWPQNQASSIDVNLDFGIDQAASSPWTTSTSVNVGLNAITLSMANFMIAGATSQITSKIESFLVGSSSGSLDFYILGDPVPFGADTHVTFTVEVSYFVKYEVCQEMPIGFGDNPC